MKIRSALALAIVMAIAACSSYNQGGPGGYGGGGAGTGDTVNISNNAFGPTTVHPDGTGRVVWVWQSGGVTHNVTFENVITGSGDKTSGNFTQTFANPGTYRFRCTIHSTDFASGMHGSVVVP